MRSQHRTCRYPGFGEALLLPDKDHITVCKPSSRTSPAYIAVRDALLHATGVGSSREDQEAVNKVWGDGVAR